MDFPRRHLPAVMNASPLFALGFLVGFLFAILINGWAATFASPIPVIDPVLLGLTIGGIFGLPAFAVAYNPESKEASS
ncbi:MAG: hypothetical protein ACE5IB_05185 [Candidatus Geothermarchaeales archaeon]